MAYPLMNYLFLIFFIATIGRLEKEAFQTAFMAFSAQQEQVTPKAEV